MLVLSSPTCFLVKKITECGSDKYSIFVLTENWWSVLEPPLFLKIVELYKDVVVHLLKVCKMGLPPSDRRILTNFLHTAFRVLEILHRVRLWCF